MQYTNGIPEYNMKLEYWIEALETEFGDSRLDVFDRHFASIDEYIDKLSAMCNKDWGKPLSLEVRQSPMTTSINEEDEVDQLMDNDSQLYDLRWAILPADNMSTSGDDSTQVWLFNTGPCYDFGWGATTEPTLDADVNNDGPIYDLGWGTTSTSCEHACVSMDNEPNWVTATPDPQQDVINLMDEDDPAYDLGWDTSTSGPDTMQQDLAMLSDEDDEPAYDLGWGRLQDTSQENMKSMSQSLTSSVHTPVDLEHVNDRHMSPKVKSRTQSPTSSSPIMDMEDVNGRDMSPEMLVCKKITGWSPSTMLSGGNMGILGKSACQTQTHLVVLQMCKTG
ncbi:uncharacterized protein BJ212DRAFT_1476717 [Suillus subaureus]|uniref:Uncharacterized protein n=1 Tax=Suillus subaureus TaxID=48587 RepID=A0A9P7EKT0_9AGAM|nr:uncharacterized protein BJ212DRAFT_1476717 [Suillus subaureus]KAG1823863.1 hypothetical protein BJ212DRAFT_1476717 [Suillus subaureus]